MVRQGVSSSQNNKKKLNARQCSKPANNITKVDGRPTIDTSAVETDHTNGTVQESSSSPVTASLRDTADIRSPGVCKTPSVKNKKASTSPVPDFITQTDQYGRASTPRKEGTTTSSSQVSSHDEVNGIDNNNMEVDACDTLLESLRMMCCCLSPENGESSHPGETPPQDSGRCFADEPVVDPSPPRFKKLLPDIHPDDIGKKCLVLDLDETLVHSSFRAVSGSDFVIPVQIEDDVHFVYVAKRPGVDEFLLEMAKYYEIVIYTASLNKYADPLLDLLDPHQTIRSRLFRESCVFYEGNYVKDLNVLDRDLSQSIIVDNSPSSYTFHPQNAIGCTSFIDNMKDRELDQIASFLKGVRNVEDVRDVCSMWKEWPTITPTKGIEFPESIQEGQVNAE